MLPGSLGWKSLDPFVHSMLHASGQSKDEAVFKAMNELWFYW